MIRISVITVGKLKEKYFLSASDEYLKRLSRYCRINVIEVEPYKASEHPSKKEITDCIADEGRRILQRIPADAHVTALCIEGDMTDSETLSREIASQAASGVGHRVYIIGGSYGLSDDVKARADRRLSMSRMTFPHQMARVMLLEQLYRAFMIETGGTYHK